MSKFHRSSALTPPSSYRPQGFKAFLLKKEPIKSAKKTLASSSASSGPSKKAPTKSRTTKKATSTPKMVPINSAEKTHLTRSTSKKNAEKDKNLFNQRVHNLTDKEASKPATKPTFKGYGYVLRWDWIDYQAKLCPSPPDWNNCPTVFSTKEEAAKYAPKMFADWECIQEDPDIIEVDKRDNPPENGILIDITDQEGTREYVTITKVCWNSTAPCSITKLTYMDESSDEETEEDQRLFIIETCCAFKSGCLQHYPIYH